MNPDYSESIPKLDWAKVHFSSPEIPEGCCDGGRCAKPIEKPFSEQLQERADKKRNEYAVQTPASPAEVAATPTIEECEAVAARFVSAQRDWNALRKKPHDPVKQPAHYTFSAVEPIVAINAWELSYNLGCVVKYIVRAKHKGNELLDLEKAAEYLRREIEFCRARLNAGEPSEFA